MVVHPEAWRATCALIAGGILSIPVDIAEFNVYSLKMVNTISSALAAGTSVDPSRYVLAYRTAWTCQILVSKEPFSDSDIRGLVSWCSDRSVRHAVVPGGIDPASISVWNDLPPVSFEKGEVQVSDTAQLQPLLPDRASGFLPRLWWTSTWLLRSRCSRSASKRRPAWLRV